MSQPERWGPVPEYEGLYEASDQGRVRSLPRKGTPGKVLSQYRGKGQMTVNLSKGSRVANRKVHHLVLLVFDGPPGPGEECLHDNGDFTDNRWENLHWGTSSQNKYDTVRHGHHHLAKLERCLRGHLLVGVNVAPWGVGRHRQCRACNAGRAAYRKGKTESVQTYADEFYAKLVAA